MHVPNGTGPGVRKSTRLMFASRTHSKCSMETSRNFVRSESVIRFNSVTFDQCTLLLYLVIPQSVKLHMKEGDSISFDEIPISTKKKSSETISNIP